MGIFNSRISPIHIQQDLSHTSPPASLGLTTQSLRERNTDTIDLSQRGPITSRGIRADQNCVESQPMDRRLLF
ncbi:hypothetical protein FPOAC1_007882 [Fusarium poae]|uniref:hypothetical protein n=1 Tax=Fusarium poae TaxID=36050 RepID=UPI001CE73695|nr:hypothetical protein FPOAC1_007882 [Fusarium poae]KAG8668501.1 hypothetical protein FPOAC1_007882 [Fusarium poae]